MTMKLVCAGCAATVLALSGCMNRGGADGASGGSSSASGTSQSYPAGSTATPSGRSPGQGAGNSGTATTDTSRDQDKQRTTR